MWIWFTVVFVFFSFSGTKLPHYLVYGITPLFILMARHRDLLTNRWLALLPPPQPSSSTSRTGMVEVLSTAPRKICASSS